MRVRDGETLSPAREVRAGLALRALPGQTSLRSTTICDITFPPIRESRGNRNSGRHGLSFFFLRRSFFAVRAGLADSGIGLQRTRTHEVKIWVQRHAGE